MTIARKRKIAVAMKTPRIRVFICPNLRLMASVVSSLRKVEAKTAMGMAKKFASCVSGITAPSSDGSTYFGTSHNPTKTFRQSAARMAQKSISEYHQKSPSRA